MRQDHNDAVARRDQANSKLESELAGKFVLVGHVSKEEHPNYELIDSLIYSTATFNCGSSTTCIKANEATPTARSLPGEIVLFTGNETPEYSVGDRLQIFVIAMNNETVTLKNGNSIVRARFRENDPSTLNASYLALDLAKKEVLNTTIGILGQKRIKSDLHEQKELGNTLLNLLQALQYDPTPEDGATASPLAAPSPGRCLEPDALVGTWQLTGLVTEAKKSAWVGANQFYVLTVKATKTGLDARLVMTGYSPDIKLSTSKQYSGSAPLAVGCHDVTLDVRLEREGDAADLHFALVPDGRDLHGVWHYQNASWDKHEARGGALARQGNGPRLRLGGTNDLPCAARCLLETTKVTVGAEGVVALTPTGEVGVCAARCP